MKIPAIVSPLFLAANLGIPTASEAATYSWTQLVPLADYDSANATKLNDLGQVVGYSIPSSLPNGDVLFRATLWDGGSASELSTLAGTKSMAFGINDAGQVVGASSLPTDSNWHATLWSNGAAIGLGAIQGYDSSIAYSINNAGQIVGDSNRLTLNPKTHDFRPTLWRNGSAVDLGGLGGTESHVHAINDAGQIVGESNNSNNTIQAVQWDSSTIGHQPQVLGDFRTTALDINSSGQVVGLSNYPVSPALATLWSNGSTEYLGDSNTSPSFATAINDTGQIVGFTNGYAALWANSTAPIDLNSVLATFLPNGNRLVGAYDINMTWLDYPGHTTSSEIIERESEVVC